VADAHAGDLAVLEEAMADETASALLLALGEEPKGGVEVCEIVPCLRDLCPGPCR
jgi:hypothetical protein